MSQDKLLRITQMNAIFLDNEIYNSLMRVIQDIARFLPPGFIAPFEPEIGLLIRMMVLKNSVLKSENTFGQQLLSIKYDNMSQAKKILYVFGNCLDYIKSRLELWKPSHKINDIFFKLHAVLISLNFVNMSVFLHNGEKPQLIERLLGLNQVYATENAPSHYESKYLARELLWNGFIDILINVLPLINYHKLKRTIRQYNPIRTRPTYVVLNNRVMTMHSKCAYCGDSPVIPQHMGCAHIFCYVCLKGNQAADSKFECPICEHTNPNVLCERVSVI